MVARSRAARARGLLRQRGPPGPGRAGNQRRRATALGQLRRRFALALSSAFAAAEPDYRFCGTTVMVVPGRVRSRSGPLRQEVQGILHASFRVRRAGPLVRDRINNMLMTYVLSPLWAR